MGRHGDAENLRVAASPHLRVFFASLILHSFVRLPPRTVEKPVEKFGVNKLSR
jgi:hypothetical protein